MKSYSWGKKKIDKKLLDYIGVGIFIFLLIGSLFLTFSLSSSEKTENVVEDLNLEPYRSEGIPEECRLPTYENRIESWKEHLSHHEATRYCLDYFK